MAVNPPCKKKEMGVHGENTPCTGIVCERIYARSRPSAKAAPEQAKICTTPPGGAVVARKYANCDTQIEDHKLTDSDERDERECPSPKNKVLAG